MHKRSARALLATLLTLSAALNATGRQAQASPYATHHADMVFVTPYMTQAKGNLGDYSSAPDGEKYLVVWLQATNRNDIPRSKVDPFVKTREWANLRWTLLLPVC